MSKMSSNLKLLVKQAGARDRVAIKKRQIGAARRSNRRSSLCRRHGQVAASKRRRKGRDAALPPMRSEEHTSELQSLMRISYAVFCLKKKKTRRTHITYSITHLQTLYHTITTTS